jgi:hypothetical protein
MCLQHVIMKGIAQIQFLLAVQAAFNRCLEQLDDGYTKAVAGRKSNNSCIV